MRKVATLTGKSLPKLSVGKPGWPELKQDPFAEDWAKVLADFTRVCDQTGLSERKD